MGKAIRVFIADSSDSFRGLLSELIQSQSDMEVSALAADGAAALELLERQGADVLITDLMLRKVDGLCLMRRLSEMGKMPRTIVVSGFFNDALAQRVSHLGADYYLPKPCRPEGLLDAVRSCVRNTEPALGEEPLEAAAREAVKEYGILPNLRGFEYLSKGIALIAAGKCPLHGVTKILYPELAKIFHTQPEGVERCIRHAIRHTWEETAAEKRKELLGGALSKLDRAPTNSELIALMVERVKNSSLGAENSIL